MEANFRKLEVTWEFQSRMNECPVCSIISGKVPAQMVHRSDSVICFLPREPEAYGHTLIAPIDHIEDIYQADAVILSKLIGAARKLALLYKEKIGATGINLLHASGVDAQQSVRHFHFHLIPRFEGDGINAWPTLPGSDMDYKRFIKSLRQT